MSQNNQIEMKLENGSLRVTPIEVDNRQGCSSAVIEIKGRNNPVINRYCLMEYIGVKGRGYFETEGRIVPMGPGVVVRITPGTKYQDWSLTDEPMVMISTSWPPFDPQQVVVEEEI